MEMWLRKGIFMHINTTHQWEQKMKKVFPILICNTRNFNYMNGLSWNICPIHLHSHVSCNITQCSTETQVIRVNLIVSYLIQSFTSILILSITMFLPLWLFISVPFLIKSLLKLLPMCVLLLDFSSPGPLIQSSMLQSTWPS